MIVTICKFIKDKFTNGKFINLLMVNFAAQKKKCLKEDVPFITSYNTNKKTMFYSAKKLT